MSSDEMKRAVDLLAEYARTGMLCIGNDEAELLRRYARTMGEWRKNYERTKHDDGRDSGPAPMDR